MHGDLQRSVLAVPPLARKVDLSLDRKANAALIRHIEQGGVSTVMYGGNANFYNIGLYEYADVLDMLLEAASLDTWIIPSAGPDFGKMLDQATILRGQPFPTAMVLPASGNSTPEGVESGIAAFVERLGKPAIIYVKSEAYITPRAIARLSERGLVKAVKYAVVREDPVRDPFLRALLDLVDPALVISGIGERPAIVHWREFGLSSFTSGSVCIAPRASQMILSALRKEDYAAAERLRAAFIPLEDCRDAWNPVRVLHDAVSLSGIADMGPVLPLMSNLDPERQDRVEAVAKELLAFNTALERSKEHAA
ncbi:MAG: dihydrodipicolinate synthase family protein [Parvibaculaceae bacterium]